MRLLGLSSLSSYRRFWPTVDDDDRWLGVLERAPSSDEGRDELERPLLTPLYSQSGRCMIILLLTSRMWRSFSRLSSIALSFARCLRSRSFSWPGLCASAAWTWAYCISPLHERWRRLGADIALLRRWGEGCTFCVFYLFLCAMIFGYWWTSKMRLMLTNDMI